MKTFITCVLALGSIIGFSSCVSVEKEPARHHATTTTEETTVTRPHTRRMETQTVRTY